MKRTLLTGFGAFGQVVNNPAQRLVEHFEVHGSPGHRLTTHVFPVSYARVRDGVAALLGGSGELPFDNVLMLGVNAGAPDWRIERYGTNLDAAGSTDMSGLTVDGREILPGRPYLLESTLPIDRIVSTLNNAGVPAVTSESAGGYLCNHLLYRALAELASRSEIAAGFVHIPADADTFVPQPDGKQRHFPSFDAHVLAIQTVLNVLA